MTLEPDVFGVAFEKVAATSRSERQKPYSLANETAISIASLSVEVRHIGWSHESVFCVGKSVPGDRGADCRPRHSHLLKFVMVKEFGNRLAMGSRQAMCLNGGKGTMLRE